MYSNSSDNDEEEASPTSKSAGGIEIVTKWKPDDSIDLFARRSSSDAFPKETEDQILAEFEKAFAAWKKQEEAMVL